MRSGGMSRDHQICAAMDEREYQLVREAARASDRSMSSFLRDAGLAAAVEILQDDTDDEEEEGADGSAVDG